MWNWNEKSSMKIGLNIPEIVISKKRAKGPKTIDRSNMQALLDENDQ